MDDGDGATAPLGDSGGPEEVTDASSGEGRRTSPIASVGIAITALAIVAAGLPWVGEPAFRTETVTVWSEVGLAFAVLMLCGFFARRHALLGRTRGALAAGTGAGGLVAYSAFVGIGSIEGGTSNAGVGVPLAFLVGLAGLALAEAERRALSKARFHAMIAMVSLSIALGLAGMIGMIIWYNLLVLPMYVAYGSQEIGVFAQNLFGPAALGLSFVTVTAFYLAATDRSVSFIDVRKPTRRDMGYTVGGVAALIGAAIAIQFVLSVVGFPGGEHDAVRAGREYDLRILLVLIPLSILVIGPAEELLYRNVIQKSLYDAFSRPGAIVVASVVFSAVHIFAYSGVEGPTLGTAGSLIAIFFLSLLLGTIYERTENVVVPALVHGFYNAFVFGVQYVGVIWL